MRATLSSNSWGKVLALGIGLGLLPSPCPSWVHAAGYVNSDQSPAGVGLAGAMSARADDASAIYYNPAGLGFQSGLSVLAGISLVNLSQSVTDSANKTYNSQGGNFVLPTIFAAARATDRLSIGLGVFVNHALTADWQDENATQPFPGRYKALKVSIQSFTFNPTIALRVVPQVSLALGLDVELGSLEVVRALALGSADGKISVAGSAVGVGGNFGALGRFLDGRLNFALTYRSGINLHFEGMQVGATAPPGVSLVFPFNQATTDLPTPHTITVGMSGKPVPMLALSFDLISTLWSDNKNQSLKLTDPNGTSQVQITPQNWHDTYSPRVGIEADFASLLPSSKLWPKARLGFGYDPTPVPTKTQDSSSPDSDRFIAAVGVSLGYRGIGSIELAYSAVIFQPRTTDNPDLPLSYSSMINVFSVALNLQLETLFGQRSPQYRARLLDRSPKAAEEETE